MSATAPNEWLPIFPIWTPNPMHQWTTGCCPLWRRYFPTPDRLFIISRPLIVRHGVKSYLLNSTTSNTTTPSRPGHGFLCFPNVFCAFPNERANGTEGIAKLYPTCVPRGNAVIFSGSGQELMAMISGRHASPRIPNGSYIPPSCMLAKVVLEIAPECDATRSKLEEKHPQVKHL